MHESKLHAVPTCSSTAIDPLIYSTTLIVFCFAMVYPATKTAPNRGCVSGLRYLQEVPIPLRMTSLLASSPRSSPLWFLRVARGRAGSSRLPERIGGTASVV